MSAFSLVFQFIGGLGLLLFGMKQMSDGIQKSAGRKMNSVLHKITGNRFFAVLSEELLFAQKREEKTYVFVRHFFWQKNGGWLFYFHPPF